MEKVHVPPGLLRPLSVELFMISDALLNFLAIDAEEKALFRRRKGQGTLIIPRHTERRPRSSGIMSLTGATTRDATRTSSTPGS